MDNDLNQFKAQSLGYPETLLLFHLRYVGGCFFGEYHSRSILAFLANRGIVAHLTALNYYRYVKVMHLPAFKLRF